MAFYRGAYFVPNASRFQAFDHDADITQEVDASWNLKPGDRMEWELSSFHGIVEVVRCEARGKLTDRLVFRKIC